MMGFGGTMGSGIWGMGIGGVLFLILIVLLIAALIKYLKR